MDLEQEFGRYGRIRDAQIIRTPDGASKGFGFITFKHLEVNFACTVLELRPKR